MIIVPLIMVALVTGLFFLVAKGVQEVRANSCVASFRLVDGYHQDWAIEPAKWECPRGCGDFHVTIENLSSGNATFTFQGNDYEIQGNGSKAVDFRACLGNETVRIPVYKQGQEGMVQSSLIIKIQQKGGDK